MLAAAAIQIDRCVSLDVCPSDKDLSTAFWQYRTEASAAEERRLKGAHPRDVVIRDVLLVGKAGHVHCGYPSSDDQPTVNCSFTIKNPRSVIYAVAKLTQQQGRWVVVDSLYLTTRTRPLPREAAGEH